jgi:hypothetical protein
MKIYEAAEPFLAELEELALEEIYLELEDDLPPRRKGWAEYAKSPAHKIEIFLDQLDAERKRFE